MKKLISIIVLILILSSSVTSLAADSYITLDPYPYFSHVLGEDLVIYGDTDFAQVTLGFYYPEDQGYKGYAKYIMTISAKELKEGYVIPTETYSRLWPEGIWKIVVQNGSVRDEMKITMSSEPIYNSIRIAEYTDNTLTNIATYLSRGMQLQNNVIEFTLEDLTEVRIFSWNNFAPTDSGETRIFIASYKDGYMTDIKTYTGNLSDYGRHITLNISENKRLELFCWNDNLTPIKQ